MIDWLILTAALPTSPSGLRVRIWRALKATGCATLREGVYILPAEAATASELWAIEQAIGSGGADAHLLTIRARNAAQEKTFRGLFDRADQYSDFAQSLKEARKSAQREGEPPLRKLLRSLDQQLAVIQRTDFFAGKPSQAAARNLGLLRSEIEAKFSPGEPGPGPSRIERLDAASYQGRTWATRRRPWIDRLGTAWLIQRFVDQRARFLWLETPAKAPKSALGFDFDGARFSHGEDKVTFEVVVHAFGLADDAALKRLGELVHYIDVGGIPVDEAAGIETLVRGLQAMYADDDALFAAAIEMFDALYSALQIGA